MPDSLAPSSLAKLDFTPEKFADLTDHGLRVRLLLDLPAKPHETLRVAVFEPATMHTGSLEVPAADTQR